MTKQEKLQLFEAWLDGDIIQYRAIDSHNNWENTSRPLWNFQEFEYKNIKKEWEPKEGQYHISNIGTITTNNPSTKETRLAGIERNNLQAAKLAATRRVYSERLSALAHGLKGEKPFTYGECNYYVAYINGKPDLFVHDNVYSPEIVYIDIDCANKIIDMINSKEVIL